MTELSMIRIWAIPAQDTADFTLSVSIVDREGIPRMSCGAVKVEDGMEVRLRDILQTARMMERFLTDHLKNAV